MQVRISGLIFIILLCLGCNKNRVEQLCSHHWQVSDVQFINEEESMVLSDTMRGNQLEVAKFQLRDILMKNVYAFHTDGTYRTGNPSAGAEGKYKLEKKAILFINDSGSGAREKRVDIERFTSDSLILLMQNDQTSLKIKLVLTTLKP